VRTRRRCAIKKWLNSCKKMPGMKIKENIMAEISWRRVRMRKTAWISRCNQRCKNTSSTRISINQSRPLKPVRISKCLLFHRGARDRNVFVNFQTSPADQRAVNIRLGEEFSRVGGCYRAAVEDADRLCGRWAT